MSDDDDMHLDRTWLEFATQTARETDHTRIQMLKVTANREIECLIADLTQNGVTVASDTTHTQDCMCVTLNMHIPSSGTKYQIRTRSTRQAITVKAQLIVNGSISPFHPYMLQHGVTHGQREHPHYHYSFMDDDDTLANGLRSGLPFFSRAYKEIRYMLNAHPNQNLRYEHRLEGTRGTFGLYIARDGITHPEVFARIEPDENFPTPDPTWFKTFTSDEFTRGRILHRQQQYRFYTVDQLKRLVDTIVDIFLRDNPQYAAPPPAQAELTQTVDRILLLL